MKDIIINNPLLIDLLCEPSDVERCGIILGTYDHGDVWRIVRLIELRNKHPEPEHNFRLSHAQVRRAVSRTIKFAPMGYWHTHNADHAYGPSPADIEEMGRYPRHVGMVIHTPSRLVTFFNNKGIIKEEVF